MEFNILISLLIGILVTLLVYMFKKRRNERKTMGYYIAIAFVVSLCAFAIMQNTNYDSSPKEMITGEPEF
jgi:putative effector of murein hydrolase